MTPLQYAIRMHGKKKKLKKPPRLLFPHTIEFAYSKKILEFVQVIKQKIAEILVPELPGLVANGPKRDEFNLDETVAEKLASLMKSITQGLDDEFPEEDISRLVEQFGEELNTFNRAQVHKVFKGVLGVDLLSSEPNLAEIMSAFVNENVSLIKSIETQFLGETEQVVLRGLRSGLRAEEISKQLLSELPSDGFVSRYGKAQGRAELIARDQANKFYGQLTEARQTAAGVDQYIWRTALDQRVREEHASREGEIFNWDDPPDDGHPGEPINCRCYAEPVIDLENI